MVLYLDELFLLDLIADYLSLLAAAKVCGVYVKRLRLLSGALLGASVSSACAVLRIAISWPFAILTLPVMTLAAFGAGGKAVRLTLAAFAFSAVFAGLMNIGGEYLFTAGSVYIILTTFAVSELIFGAVFRNSGRRARTLSAVTLISGGDSLSFTALNDTGNLLRDGVSGRGVMVLDPELASKLFPELRTAASAEALAMRGLMPVAVPFRSLGNECGAMTAFRPEKLVVDGRAEEGMLVAIAPGRISGEDFDAVMSV